MMAVLKPIRIAVVISTGGPPCRWRLQSPEDVGGGHRNGAGGQQRCDGMGNAPVFAQHTQQERIPVGVERRLRKEEIDVRCFAVCNQPCGDEVIAFVPGKGAPARVDDEHGCHQRDGAGNRRWNIVLLSSLRPETLPLARCGGFDDLPVAHVDDAMTEVRSFRIVGDHEDRLAETLVQVAQEIEHGERVGGIEIAGGLVSEQDRGNCSARARAMAMRCCSPPDISVGR